MILCIGTTPAVQRVMLLRKLTIDSVNRAHAVLDGAAGKSVNVAKVLKTLGAETVATGFLGGARGDYLRTALEGRGIQSDFVQVASQTRLCVTVIDEAAGTQTELVEEGPSVDARAFEELAAVVGRRVRGAAAVVMSGTIAPGGATDLYARCTQMSHEVGALSVVDAHGVALLPALKAGPGLVKPNRAELAASLGRELADEAAVMRGMREMVERGAQRVVVTAGKDPALAFDGRRFWRITIPTGAVVNAIGSGDAFAAGLTWGLTRGDDLGEACRWGAAAGSANTLTPMPGELRVDDVERLARLVEVRRV